MAVRQCPGIGLLRKDHLVYELAIRGQPTDGSVPELAARLRAAVLQPVDVSPHVVGEIDVAIEFLRDAVRGLRDTIGFLEGTQPSGSQLDRVRAQLIHLTNRIADLRTLQLEDRCKQSTAELGSLMNELQFKLACLEFDGMRTGEQDLLSLKEDASQPRNDALTSPERIDLEFAKLPNPLVHLFRDITEVVVDRLEQIEGLLWLLVRLEQHADAFGVSHQVVLSLLYPLARGELRTLISRAMAERFSLRRLRELVINERLTMGTRKQLECRYIWQMQQDKEGLHQYVDRVKMASLALLVDLPESELVSIVLRGMRAADKSHFVFRGRPSTWEELRAATVAISALPFAEDSGREVKVHAAGVINENARLPASAQSPKGEMRRCFRCGRTGHLVRACVQPRVPRNNK